jgi:glycosyltransferase involved in cell wall biosynthesis
MQEKEILWLASWYPNEKNPVAGDFIQRHAIAVSAYRKLTVIYMDQSGWAVNSTTDKITVTEKSNLTEICCFFPFSPTRITILDKLLYNLRYERKYKHLLREYITEKNKPELIHVHIPLKAGKLALWAKRKWGIPFIVSEQSSTYLPAAPDHFYKRSTYYRYMVKQIFRESLVATNVSATVGCLIEKITGKKIIRVIHNTVDPLKFFYKPAAHKKFRFIHVSAMNDQKNIFGLLESFGALFAQREDWELRLVGPVSSSLQERLENLEWADKITCSGELPYEQVAIEMHQASAFVLFSRHENFPCVIIEALSCGLPVITSDAGGSGEAITKENGLIVPVDDTGKMLTALNFMLDHIDDYNKNEIALDAKNRYSYPVIGKQFAALYQEIGLGSVKP